MGGRVEIADEIVLHRGWSVLSRLRILYTRTNGVIEEQVREIFNSGDGAAVLLYNPTTQNILLVRQFRLVALLQGHSTGFLLEVCAGMLDHHTPESAIQKEIKEETGYEIVTATKLFSAYASPGAHMEKIHFFAAAYSDQLKVADGGGDSHEGEDIELVEVSFDDIPKLLSSGQVEDQKTIVLLQWAQLNLPALLG